MPPYVRLWAEEAMVRNYQRFVETARKLRYLNDGDERIKDLLSPPPETPEQQMERHRRRFASDKIFMQALNESMASLTFAARAKESEKKR